MDANARNALACNHIARALEELAAHVVHVADSAYETDLRVIIIVHDEHGNGACRSVGAEDGGRQTVEVLRRSADELASQIARGTQ